MTDPGCTYDYPPAVRFEIHDDTISDYVAAAEFLNGAGFDVVCLQHEYGIFGGKAGGNIIELLSRLEMPVVTTLHTVLGKPTAVQYEVMNRIIELSAKIVVMSEKSYEFLRAVHDVPARKIEIIPHGIPDFPFLEPHHAKAKFDFTGRMIVLTFGLLSPNKGIETMLDAMPEIIKSCPNALYVILGATHPNLLRKQGEAYRDSLTERVRDLGVENHVVLFNQFVDQATLLDFISMCDVYATPYLNEAQMTSGTLAYSFGLGKAVVSTPYWHAKELLSDGCGVLVPFGDTKTLGAEIAGLLTNDVRRYSMGKRAYAASRSMTWMQTAERYVTAFETESGNAQPRIPLPVGSIAALRNAHVVPEIRIGHFLSLCDSTGILQHAIYSVPDRSHGYCVDDNARALLFSSSLQNFGEVQLSNSITAGFAAFIQHAWNPATRRFRNFMSYDRRWLEDQGSEDSHGRTLWALGECARKDIDPSRRRWAGALFETALPIVAEFSSPRAWAFTLLGLDAYCGLAGGDALSKRVRGLLADRLMSLISATETKDWIWFEDLLAYDNARLPEALIKTGLATETPRYIEVGVRSLRWLNALQTTPSGHFRPVGPRALGDSTRSPKRSINKLSKRPQQFRLALRRGVPMARPSGQIGALRAFEWFLGENDLQTPLIDPETGSCSDGLHSDRCNENKGAELVLSYLLSLVEIRRFKSLIAVDGTRLASKFVGSDASRMIPPRAAPGSLFVPIPIHESPGSVSSPGPGEGRRQALQTGN